MNKLSDLLYLREQLTALDASQLERAAKLARTNFMPIDFLTYDKTKVQTIFDDFVVTVDALRSNVVDTIKQIDADIANLKVEYFKGSKEEEVFHLRASVQDNRELRDMFMHPVAKEEVAGRIGIHTDWRYPGLEIGPGDGVWTPYLVAQDPLYIVDVYDEFLKSTISKFTPEYQRRMRPYKVKHGDLSALPKEQFGFVFTWNVFNYFSIDTIKMYLERIMPLLKPGGVVMFSYNNGERWKCAELFENNFMTYVPKSDLENIILALGYEIITSRDIDTHVSWFEIKRPGELSSLRAGQTLAKIIDQ